MKLSTKIRIFIIVLIAGFCGLCAVFVPRGAEYIAGFAAEKGLEIAKTAVFALGTALCAPCVALLALAWRFADAVERDEVFTARTAQRLSLISAIFIADCALFLCGIVAMFCFGELLLSPLFALIDLIGFGIGVLLRILSGYIRRAAELKEEVEGTL